MKKIIIALIAVIVSGFIFVSVTSSKYNELVKKEESLGAAYGQLQNQLRAQFEKLPNFVNTVQAEAKFEKDTFTGVAEARSKAGGIINLDASKIANDPEAQKKLAEAQNSLSQTIGRILSVQERYPELKANSAFKDLRTVIEGSNLRVAIARRDVQNITKSYNEEVRQMPGNIVAWIYGFRAKPYFDAGNEAQSGSGLVNFNKDK